MISRGQVYIIKTEDHELNPMVNQITNIERQ